MKQHTTPEQTAKLIELGVEKPRCATMFWQDNKEVTEINYTIGELLSFLPIRCLARGFDYRRVLIEDGVFYYNKRTGDCIIGFVDHKNLIDNIFDAIVRLKEKGVI